MTNSDKPSNRDPARGVPQSIEPGTTDLGDDVYRDADNNGSTMRGGNDNDGSDLGSGLPIQIDPGATDLGNDGQRR